MSKCAVKHSTLEGCSEVWGIGGVGTLQRSPRKLGRTHTPGSDDSAAESSLTQNHPRKIGRNDSAAESATSAESSRQVVRNTRPTKHRAEREARSDFRSCSVRTQIAGQGHMTQKCCKTQHIRRTHRSVRSRRSRHPSEKPTKNRTSSHTRGVGADTAESCFTVGPLKTGRIASADGDVLF